MICLSGTTGLVTPKIIFLLCNRVVPEGKGIQRKAEGSWGGVLRKGQEVELGPEELRQPCLARGQGGGPGLKK